MARYVMLTDPMLYSPRSDIDDSLAILYLAGRGRSPRIIATTEGNSSAKNTYRTALLLKERLGLEAGVHPSPRAGSAAPHSTDALSLALDSGYDVLAVAPLTYLAEALRRTSAKRLGKLVVMGGSFRVKAFGLLPEFNFWRDPAAAQRVIMDERWREVVIVPLDTTTKVRWSCRRLIQVLRSFRETRWMAQAVKPWCITSTLLFKGFVPHDVLAAQRHLDEPGLFVERQVRVVVRGRGFLEESPGGRLATVLDVKPEAQTRSFKYFVESVLSL